MITAEIPHDYASRIDVFLAKIKTLISLPEKIVHFWVQSISCGRRVVILVATEVIRVLVFCTHRLGTLHFSQS